MLNHVLTDAEMQKIRNAATSTAHIIGGESAVVTAVEQVLSAQFPNAERNGTRLDGDDREAILEAVRKWKVHGAVEDLFQVVAEVVAARRQTLRYRD